MHRARRILITVNLLILVYIIINIQNVEGDSYATENATNNSSEIQELVPKTYTKKWISQMIIEAKRMFHVVAPPQSACARDIYIYEQHVKIQSAWAIRMLESSQWPKTGLLYGASTYFGNWAECLRSQSPDGIYGQYCLVELVYNFSWSCHHSPSMDWPDESESAWDTIKAFESNKIRLSRQQMVWAMCIPSSCSSEDLKGSLQKSVSPVFAKYGFKATIHINPEHCQTQKIPNPGGVGPEFLWILGLCLCGTILVTIIFASYKDITESFSEKNTHDLDEDSLGARILRCFSVRQSWKHLTRPLDKFFLEMYGVKFWGMVIEIFVHLLIIQRSLPNIDKEHVESDTLFVLLFGAGPMWINVYFAFGATLLAYNFDLTPPKSIKEDVQYLFHGYILRWIRMMAVPIVLLTQSFYTLGTLNRLGPLWSPLIREELNKCSKKWLVTVLGIQNFVDPENMCFLTTWYLAVDMQLYVISTVLLLIYRRNPKRGIITMILVGLVSMAYTFGQSIYHGHDALLVFPDLGTLHVVDSINKPLLGFYFKTYLRIVPYLLGCGTALWLRHLKGIRYQFSMVQIHMMLIISFIAQLLVIFYNFILYILGRSSSALLNATFTTLSGPLFVLLPLTYACIRSSYYSTLEANKLSGPRWIRSLVLFERKVKNIVLPQWVLYSERLVFGMYLASAVIQVSRYVSMSQVLVALRGVDVLWLFVPDVLITMLLAFVSFILVEAPASNLAKIIRQLLVRKTENKVTKKLN